MSKSRKGLYEWLAVIGVSALIIGVGVEIQRFRSKTTEWYVWTHVAEDDYTLLYACAGVRTTRRGQTLKSEEIGFVDLKKCSGDPDVAGGWDDPSNEKCRKENLKLICSEPFYRDWGKVPEGVVLPGHEQ